MVYMLIFPIVILGFFVVRQSSIIKSQEESIRNLEYQAQLASEQLNILTKREIGSYEIPYVKENEMEFYLNDLESKLNIEVHQIRNEIQANRDLTINSLEKVYNRIGNTERITEREIFRLNDRLDRVQSPYDYNPTNGRDEKIY